MYFTELVVIIPRRARTTLFSNKYHGISSIFLVAHIVNEQTDYYTLFYLLYTTAFPMHKVMCHKTNYA